MNPTITHLRELLSKGTPGPWRHGRRAPVVCNATGEPILWDDTICSDTDPNVDLVVAAINALPTLLDRLAKLERDLAEWQMEHGRDSFESAKLTTGEFNEP